MLENLEKIAKRGCIYIDDKKYQIDFHCGGDLKFLALLYGINAANSLFPCLWCTCCKDFFYDWTKKWSLTDVTCGARTIKNTQTDQVLSDIIEPVEVLITVKVKKSKKTKKIASNENKIIPEHKNGQINEPIINFIDFYKCVIDLLHLFLRITDRLMELLIKDLIEIDGNESADLSKRPSFSRLLDFLNGIMVNAYYTKKNSKTNITIIKLRTFNGNEKLKILQKIDITQLNAGQQFFSKHDTQNQKDEIRKQNDLKFNNISILWKRFLQLFIKISYPNESPTKIEKLTGLTCELSTKYDIDISQNIELEQDSLENKLKNWLRHFLDIYFATDITPYIHCFVFHIPQFLDLYSDIDVFNLQGLERFNKCSIRYYHGATNRQNKDMKWVKQLINKRMRLEYFHLNGIMNDIDLGEFSFE